MSRPGPTSFKDLRTVEGDICNTFTEAAEKLGLFKNDQMFIDAMNDACNQYSSRVQLQRYFAMLVFYTQPDNPQKLFDDYLDQLYPPPSVQPGHLPMDPKFRRDAVMRNLEYFFRTLGKSAR